MATNKNNHIITNQIVWIRQLFFAHATFLSISKVSVVFNVLSSHYNTNLPIRSFLQKKKKIISKYLSILDTLLHSSVLQVLGFYIQSSFEELQTSNSLHLCRHSSSFYFCFKYIHFRLIHKLSFNHFEVKVLFHFVLTLN